MAKFIHSRLIRWLILNGIFYLILLTVLRIIFHIVYKPAGETGVVDVLWMGLRYDARVVGVFLIIPFLASSFYFFKPFFHKISKKILLVYANIFGLLLIIFYTIDFAFFAYLRQRLNASILSYAEDTQISASMVWQSYPVIKILLLWIVCFVVLFFVTKKIYNACATLPVKVSKTNIVSSFIVFFLILGVSIFGRIGQFPLRWSDAYRFNSDYKANLALNPFQSFASSLKFRHSGFEIEKTKKYYGLMADVFSVSKQDSTTMNFDRMTIADERLKNKTPNVVLVICESFSAYKSSMWGNPLNTTPYFNQLCKEGVFFKNCYTPTYGTARGIWALLTGIPDVTSIKTASRNPSIVDQYSMLNKIDGYEKLYFIGGSASWANIRGVIKDNVKDMKLYEQEDYASKAIDVWGISDKDLFMESNDVLKKQTKPFFAVIQTADNHRPYTIPKKDRPFIKMRDFPKDTLAKYGFWSNEELNAYAYMDYTYKSFLEAAAKESYFNNTIFVFIGDHGIRGNAGDMMPKVWTEKGLTTVHVPLLFYAPGMLQPDVVEKKVSQLDVMPSISGLINKPIINKTMGRNVFSNLHAPDSDYYNNHAFIYDPDLQLIGLVNGKYYFEHNLQTKKDDVYSLLNNDPLPPGLPTDKELLMLRNITLGYYETARYLLYNNKKSGKH